MGTSGDLTGKLISTKIILSLMGSPCPIDGLADKNHASRAGHFFSPTCPSIPAPQLLWFLSLTHFSPVFLLYNLLFPPHFLSLCASACSSVKLTQIQIRNGDTQPGCNYTFNSIYNFLILIDKNSAWTEKAKPLVEVPTMSGYQSVTATELYKNSRINIDVYAAVPRHRYRFVWPVFMPSLDARRYFVKP